MLGILTDVTERRREEEAQRRAEANLRAVIERSPDGMLVHRFGQIVFVNTRLVKMLGYDHAEQLIGRSPLLLVAPEAREHVESRMRRVTAGIETTLEHQRLVCRDGGMLHAEVKGLPVTFDGEPAVLVHVRDLTEHHRLEAELRARDRLASVGRLAAAIGHEINNPLTYVVGNVELASRAIDQGGDAALTKARSLLADAAEGAERIRRIVRDLRTFSQTDRDEVGEVDVGHVLDSCLAMAAHEIRHRARVRRDYAELPAVVGNEARLGQVFLNLLVNAAQAIPAGRADDNEIAVEGRVDGERVVVVVRDSGVGVDPEARERLFEPFFTTKSTENGTGLGLAICRNIVSSIGGDIRLDSEPGRGTAVTVCLARAPSSDAGARETAQGTGARDADADSALGACRVLIVDDEPRVARAVAALLSSTEAVIATSGEAALERLGAGESFDAVLCDVMMPKMTGMDFYERARALRPGIERRFVFMSGGAFTTLSGQFLASVPNATLEKPFSAAQLQGAIDGVLGGRRSR
jgi:PAS domain S-box-containing protein